MPGMDIILDTVFSNPYLPVDPPVGFYDNFNRPDGPIGVTSGEARPWNKLVISAGDGEARVSNNQAAAVGTSGAYGYLVDARSADGALSTTITNVTADGGQRLLARCQDYSNTLMLTILTASGRMVLDKRVLGVSTTLADVAINSGQINGKKLSIILSGSSVSVVANGVTVITPVSVTDLQANTSHGFFFNASQLKTYRYDDFEFSV